MPRPRRGARSTRRSPEKISTWPSPNLVDEISIRPTVAVGLTKWLLHAGRDASLEQHLRNEAFALELSSRSDDFREGMAAMREKRDPKFTGT